MNFDSKMCRRAWSLRGAGFTLIELMIVVAIVAVLAAIAIPTYSNYVVRTHRVAAESCLSEYANYMERYYTTNLSYNIDKDDFPILGCASASQTGPNYNYNLASATSSAYTVEAVPQGSQATRDAECGTLSLDQTGTRTASASTDASKCW